MMAGMSINTIAAEVGVTHQQVQKYEKGINRISAEKLKLVADFLGVDIREFYASSEELPDIPNRSRCLLEMTRHYANMSEEKRRALLSMARALAA
jgi:transcriptional regulator with XRE-family HTH domain